MRVRDLREGYCSGRLRPTEVCRALFAEIARQNTLNAYLCTCEDSALAAAEELEQQYRCGKDPGCLGGIPIAIKDNLNVKGYPTTCGSKILAGYRSGYHATLVSKLLAQGAIIVGKNNLDEFAMGSSNETSAYGPVRNPFDERRVAGGSSGGSAAAVAANLCCAAIGSDTGGSIRQPAAFCGVVGVRPTYGRVSRFGLLAYASSFDQAGPIASCVEDAATILTVISGQDHLDATSAPVAVPDFTENLNRELPRLRIGLPTEYFTAGVDASIKAGIESVVDRLRSTGIEFHRLSLPHTDYALPVYHIVANAEASANLARYDGVRYGFRATTRHLAEMYKRTRTEGFGQEVKRRIMVGAFTLSSGYIDAYYTHAQKVRTLIKQDFEAAFSKVDAILTPVTPTLPFFIGEKFDDPLVMYLSDILTIPASLAGLPAMSLPIGTVGSLPIGLQIISRHFDEKLMFQLAATIERGINHASVI